MDEHKRNIEIGKRLAKIRHKLELNQSNLAKSLGIHLVNISKIETGKTNPSFSVIYTLAMVHNISIDWLLFGKGQMFMKPDDHILNNIPEIYIKIIEELESKSPEKRSQILQLILNAIELAKKDIS